MQDQDSAYAIVSSDCHAGADVFDYKPYLESRWHEDFDVWAATYRDPWLAFEQAVDDRAADREADGRTRRAGAVNGIIPTNWDSQARFEGSRIRRHSRRGPVSQHRAALLSFRGPDRGYATHAG